MNGLRGKAHWLALAITAHLTSGFIAEACHEIVVETSILPVMHIVEHVIIRAESALIGGE